MRLLTIIGNDGAHRLGVQAGKGVVDVAASLADRKPGATPVPATIGDLLAGGRQAQQVLAAHIQDALADTPRAAWYQAESVLRLGPCLPHPGKIICVGLNYRQHAAEAGLAVPGTPVLFSKYGNALAGPGEAIPLPAGAEQYDYEVELAVVIGRRARNISETEALNHVFGYCTANDLSARDQQNRTSQWLLGKTLDKFLPIGAHLVTADEVGDPQNLQLRTWVNGSLRQDSNTGDMIFPVAHIISYISRYFTLEPGDLISTGTPQGVIAGMADKHWLRAGDEVTVEVEKLGRLSNVMVAGE